MFETENNNFHKRNNKNNYRMNCFIVLWYKSHISKGKKTIAADKIFGGRVII